MPTFDGIIRFDQERIPVTVGVDPDRITLVSGETDVGEWSTDECTITDEGAGTWLIEAEDDALSFAPEEPGRFAHSLEAHGVTSVPAEAKTDSAQEAALVADGAEDSDDEIEIVEGPPPKTQTVIAFYVLAVITAALGIWAFVSLF